MVETIKVPANVNFLNEWTGFELPRGIVNKGITGCGATTLAIEDEHKTISCSPRINLIKNKCQQHKETLAVYGDVKNGEIEDYYKDFVKGVTSDDLPQLQGYTKQGIQRKLNILCKVDRKQIDCNRVRIYTLKDKTQNPDLWNIIEYIHYGESEEDKEEEE